MAKRVTKDATILVHNLDISGLSNNADTGVMVEALECTSYASEGWKEYLASMKDGEATIEGMLDVATLEPILLEMAMSSTLYPLLVANSRPLVLGDVAIFVRALLLQFSQRKAVSQIYGYSAQFKGERPWIRGQVLYNDTLVASGDSDDLDLGSGVPSGEHLFGAVFVLAVDGTSPTLDLVLESDVDDTFGSPTTRATIPQFTDTGSYYFEVAGPITDEFYRIAATLGGTDTPSFEYVFVIGRSPIA